MLSSTNWFLLLAGGAVNLISFGAGTAYSWTSPVLPKLHSNTTENPLGRVVTAFEESWICSLVNIGGAIGPFVSNLLNDKIGCKRSLLYASVIMIVAYLLKAFARTVELYYLARFIVGLGDGVVFSITPMYLGEIAEDRNRGLLGVLFCLSLTSGTLFSYVVGPFTSIQNLSLFCVIPLVLFLIIFGIFIPESPYFYLLKNNKRTAEISLKKLRSNSANIQKELDDMTVTVDLNRDKIQLRDLFKSKTLIKSLSISVSLLFFQQFTGISVFLSYLQSIFDATGSDIKPEISSMILGAVQVIVCVVTSQLVDRLGRRFLLIVSMSGTILSTSFLGLYFFLREYPKYTLEAISWLPICCLIMFMFSYNFGIGPLAWSMLGELFPANFKTLASTLATSVCFIIAFLTTVVFPNFIQSYGMGISFWIFTIISTIGLIFVICIVPETKGRSFQEIQELLSGNKICREDKENC